jgi:anti-sigma B factor antagonist
MSSVIVTEMGSVRVVEVTGRLDGESAPELGREMDHAVDQGCCQLVLDLGSVDYISSPGLREIVRVYKRVLQDGGDLRVANPSDRVMAVMELAGLDNTLQIYQTQLDAVNSF